MNYKIIQGDCLEVMKSMDDNSVDMIFTDPPYNINKADWDNLQIIPDQYISEFSRLLKETGSVYICWSCLHLETLLPCFKRYFRLSNIIVWNYRNGVTQRANHNYAMTWEAIVYGVKSKPSANIFRNFSKFGNNNFDVWEIPVPQSNWKLEKKQHPTQKPIAIVKKAIIASTNENDLVFDPFCGSGTTGVAAVQMGRKFIGIEKNEVYVKMSERRITNEQPLFNQRQ